MNHAQEALLAFVKLLRTVPPSERLELAQGLVSALRECLSDASMYYGLQESCYDDPESSDDS